jgi:hypothetical protein
MSNKAIVQEFLEKEFRSNKVNPTKEGFKINCIDLRESEVRALDYISHRVLSIKVKRSGTGLVVLIKLYEGDRET